MNAILILTVFYSGVTIHHVEFPTMALCEAAAAKWVASTVSAMRYSREFTPAAMHLPSAVCVQR